METTPNTPGRKPGTPKTGGRKRGTPNKVTKEVRKRIAAIVARNARNIQSDLDALEPRDRLQILEKLMQYVIPKQSALKAEISDLTDDELTSVATIILNTLNHPENE